ncbi:MAG TPA: pentapeptide repeat-containing protein [Galbitalea sp.]
MAKHNSSPAPRITFSAPTGLSDGDVQTLEPHESREGERFDGGDLTDADLSGASLLECVLDAVTLTDTGLRGARFVDSVVSASFATSLVAARSTWRTLSRPGWPSATAGSTPSTSPTPPASTSTCATRPFRESSESRECGARS